MKREEKKREKRNKERKRSRTFICLFQNLTMNEQGLEGEDWRQEEDESLSSRDSSLLRQDSRRNPSACMQVSQVVHAWCQLIAACTPHLSSQLYVSSYSGWRSELERERRSRQRERERIIYTQTHSEIDGILEDREM